MKTAQPLLKKRLAMSIALLILFVGSHNLSHTVHAQTNNRNITIVPPSETLTVKPGYKSEGQLKVINDSDETLTFSAGTQDFIVEDTVGTPDFLPKDTLGKPYSAAAWIGVVPDNFTIAPHQKALLRYYLQVPTTARPGGHYAGVLYAPTTTFGGKGSGPAVQTQIGTLFAIDVAGPIHEEAVVTKFKAEHGFYEYGPANILTQIKNMGDLHIKPLGTVTVYDMFGRKLGTLPLDQHNIFPTASRDFVNIFGQHLMIGPFTAKFAASYGREGNLPLTASMTFWVFPWKVSVIILLVIVAAIMGYLVWKRRKDETNKPNEPHHTEQHLATPVTPQAPTQPAK